MLEQNWGRFQGHQTRFHFISYPSCSLHTEGESWPQTHWRYLCRKFTSSWRSLEVLALLARHLFTLEFLLKHQLLQSTTSSHRDWVRLTAVNQIANRIRAGQRNIGIGTSMASSFQPLILKRSFARGGCRIYEYLDVVQVLKTAWLAKASLISKKSTSLRDKPARSRTRGWHMHDQHPWCVEEHQQ